MIVLKLTIFNCYYYTCTRGTVGGVRHFTWHDGGRHDEELNAGGAGAVAQERHVVRVAAEECNVLLHPVERRHLVHQPVVGDPSRRVRRRVGVQEPLPQDLQN